MRCYSRRCPPCGSAAGIPRDRSCLADGDFLLPQCYRNILLLHRLLWEAVPRSADRGHFHIVFRFFHVRLAYAVFDPQPVLTPSSEYPVTSANWMIWRVLTAEGLLMQKPQYVIPRFPKHKEAGSFENAGVSLILSDFAGTWIASCIPAFRKEDAAINLMHRKPLSCTAAWRVKPEAEPWQGLFYFMNMAEK